MQSKLTTIAEKKGLCPTELAVMTGLARPTVYAHLSGRNGMSVAAALAYSRALKTPVEAIVEPKKPATPKLNS